MVYYQAVRMILGAFCVKIIINHDVPQKKIPEHEEEVGKNYGVCDAWKTRQHRTASTLAPSRGEMQMIFDSPGRIVCRHQKTSSRIPRMD